MVNIPRALFSGRTGRESRYHLAIEELQDWAYKGNRVVPLSDYPGIFWERPKSRKHSRDVDYDVPCATGLRSPAHAPKPV